MDYGVVRHSAPVSKVVRFMKVNPDSGAVYFTNDRTNQQWIINPPSGEVTGGAFASWLSRAISNKGLKTSTDQILKATEEYLKVNGSSVKHSDEDDLVEAEIIDDGVEPLDTPYPEKGKAQIPKRCFIYDDEDGYPEGWFDNHSLLHSDDYLSHHGILGMKWGVRRYQNEDGSLTDEGRKHYNVKSVTSIQNELGTAKDINEKRKILTKADESAEKQRKRSTAVGVAAASTLGLIGKKDAFEVGTAVWDIAEEIGIPSAIAENVLGNLAFALATPVGKIALIGAGSLAAATSIYSVYKKVKVAKMAEDLNRSEAEKPLKVQYDPSTTTEQAKELDKLYSQHTGRQIESSIRKPSDRPAASPRHMSVVPNNPKDPGTFEQRRSAYISEHKSELLKNAKDNGTFDMEFLESNGDTDKYGAPLEGKELMAAYEKYLDEEIKRGK